MAERHPWHLPALGWLAVLVTALAALDYLLVQLRVGAYLGLFSEPVAAYFTALPPWLDAVWALAVWPGLLGALCLAGGARMSAFLLGIAAVAMVVLTAGLLAFTDPDMVTVTGFPGLVIMVVGTLLYVVFWLYARQMHAAGRLP